MGLLQYYLKSTFCSPRHKSAFGIVRILQTLRHVARIDHHHGQPSEHEIPMRRSPRARRSSLSVADISPSHGCRAGSWARCSLRRMVALLYTSHSLFTCFTTELRPCASDLLRRRTSKAPATEQLKLGTPPNAADQTGSRDKDVLRVRDCSLPVAPEQR